jgi:hypothetical protein
MRNPSDQGDGRRARAYGTATATDGSANARLEAPTQGSTKAVRPEVSGIAACLEHADITSLPATEGVIGLPVTVIDHLAQHAAPTDSTFRHRVVPKATLDRQKRSAARTLTAVGGDRAAKLAKHSASPSKSTTTRKRLAPSWAGRISCSTERLNRRGFPAYRHFPALCRARRVGA